MNRWNALAFLLAIVSALALRLPKLDARPLHNDEAVNAFKVTELWANGRYAYDPDEYHGPTLHYFTLPFLWFSGARDANQLEDSIFRLTPIAFGVGLIFLLPLFADGLGWRALGWTAFFTAISPAMVFYSRYFIHEMLLVFFTALTLGAGWRYWNTRKAHWALFFGLGVGLMWATKETFVLALVAMMVALAGTVFGQNAVIRRIIRLPAAGTLSVMTAPTTFCNSPTVRHAALALLGIIVIWLVLFSSFFTHGQGLVDSVRTYLPWLKRAGGHSPHIQPWDFYLERLLWFHPARSPVWSEGLIGILAVIGGGVSVFGGRTVLHRFLTFYTLVLITLYCVIAYKTPWCLLGFYHGMVLLAGVGVATLLEWTRQRWLRLALTGLLIGLTAQLSWQAVRGSFLFPANRRNPYVYAQTTPDYLKLIQTVQGIAKVSPDGWDTVVKVAVPGSDYWPLPWHLRRFEQVGWYAQMPPGNPSPIMILSSQFNARLDEATDKKWILAAIHELRPKVYLELYVELELWKRYVETLPRNREG